MLNDEAIRVLNCIQKRCRAIIADCDKGWVTSKEESSEMAAYRFGACVVATAIFEACNALIKGEIRGDDE